MSNKLKILQVVPSLSQANGVAAYISTYFQNIDKSDLDISFLVLNNKDHGRYNEIKQNGGKIIEIFREKNILKYFSKIDNLFKREKYDIVHCHVPNYGAFVLWFAKRNNVKVRILHSHVNKSADKFFQRLRNNILSPIAVFCANKYIACSDEAGKYLFKNKNFTVINNAIDIEKYRFNENIRKQIRKDLKLEGKFVIGEFARLCPQKNQLFMIDIMNEILKTKKNAILLLVGNGPLEKQIRKKIADYKIEKNVIFLGSRNDVDKLYNAIDVFVLPSIYEGLGIVLIEAQANGLNCFTSLDLVPQTANISSLMHYIKLKGNSDEWASEILNCNSSRINVTNEIINNGFDIKKESNNLKKLYKDLIKKDIQN